jgi:hypothetical protein
VRKLVGARVAGPEISRAAQPLGRAGVDAPRQQPLFYT